MPHPPIRLLHIADIHIGMENYGRLDPDTGIHGRVMDFLRRLSDAVDYALDNEIDVEPRPLRYAEYLDYSEHWHTIGARAIGGCCGVGPDYIRALHESIRPE